MLNPTHLTLIKALMDRHLSDKNVQVYAFGSRVEGTFRADSDLDLMIVAPQSLNPGLVEKLRAELEESTLPYRVDLMEQSRLPESISSSIAGLKKEQIWP